jgi:hypothetical protein
MDMDTLSTRKVRRDVRGGKRGQGHALQREGRRVQRPNACAVTMRETDAALTSMAGLVGFAAFLRRQGIDRALSRRYARLKTGPGVVYPMGAQLRLLMDTYAVGEGRVFGVEALASDPVFVHLAGGYIPSIDTLYTDLARFDEDALRDLEELMAEQGLARVARRRFERVHVDIDTTVTVLFGEQEGAHPGPNPRYRGRPSHHPIFARVAEVDAIIGALLRPGDTGCGAQDAATVRRWLVRLRGVVGPDCVIVVRIDAAADCTALLEVLDRLGVYFIVKARVTQDLAAAITKTAAWRTVDEDAEGRPFRQVATVVFSRGEWRARALSVRVVAVRSRERESGRQLYLWADNDFTTQAFLTNDWHAPEDDLAHTYDGRAGIEPLIAELKNGFALGKATSASFAANHAALLLKMLAYNLVRAYVEAHVPALRTWRAPWLRRAIFLRPGRLTRSGRRTTLHTKPLAVPMLR